MTEKIDPDKVIARIPNHEAIFTASLEGCPLAVDIAPIDDVVTFLESYQPWTRLKIM